MTTMTAEQVVRALIQCNTPAQKIRRLLKETGLKAKVTTGQMSQLTDNGWRGGPKTASASVLCSDVSAEAMAILEAVRLSGISVEISRQTFGAPDTHTYEIRAQR